MQDFIDAGGARLLLLHLWAALHVTVVLGPLLNLRALDASGGSSGRNETLTADHAIFWPLDDQVIFA